MANGFPMPYEAGTVSHPVIAWIARVFGTKTLLFWTVALMLYASLLSVGETIAIRVMALPSRSNSKVKQRRLCYQIWLRCWSLVLCFKLIMFCENDIRFLCEDAKANLRLFLPLLICWGGVSCCTMINLWLLVFSFRNDSSVIMLSYISVLSVEVQLLRTSLKKHLSSEAKSEKNVNKILASSIFQRGRWHAVCDGKIFPEKGNWQESE